MSDIHDNQTEKTENPVSQVFKIPCSVHYDSEKDSFQFSVSGHASRTWSHWSHLRLKPEKTIISYTALQELCGKLSDKLVSLPPEAFAEGERSCGDLGAVAAEVLSEANNQDLYESGQLNLYRLPMAETQTSVLRTHDEHPKWSIQVEDYHSYDWKMKYPPTIWVNEDASQVCVTWSSTCTSDQVQGECVLDVGSNQDFVAEQNVDKLKGTVFAFLDSNFGEQLPDPKEGFREDMVKGLEENLNKAINCNVQIGQRSAADFVPIDEYQVCTEIHAAEPWLQAYGIESATTHGAPDSMEIERAPDGTIKHIKWELDGRVAASDGSQFCLTEEGAQNLLADFEETCDLLQEEYSRFDRKRERQKLEADDLSTYSSVARSSVAHRLHWAPAEDLTSIDPSEEEPHEMVIPTKGISPEVHLKVKVHVPTQCSAGEKTSEHVPSLEDGS